jgi:hypothetical protein
MAGGSDAAPDGAFDAPADGIADAGGGGATDAVGGDPGVPDDFGFADDAAVVLPPEDEGCTCRVAATPAAPVLAPFSCALLALVRLARRRRRG